MASDSDCSDDENILGNEIVPGFDYSDLESASENEAADDSNDSDFNISEFNSNKRFSKIL